MARDLQPLSWRESIASLNLLITSTVWRQDHNGFTHQDPGFLDLVVNKSAAVTRIYLPPDVNCLLSVADHCLRSQDYINVIVCDKQNHLQYMTMEQATVHCKKGIGIWDFASNDEGVEPDLVMASAGDMPTKEALAATMLLRKEFPDLKLRFINVVDLFRLQPQTEHPHGLSDRDFDSLFTSDKPVIFNFHGYPWLIHRLAYRRTNHANFHVRGYKEKGNINTPLSSRSKPDRPLLARDRRDRPDSEAAGCGGARQGPLPRRTDPLPRLRARPRDGQARGFGLDLAPLGERPGGSAAPRPRPRNIVATAAALCYDPSVAGPADFFQSGWSRSETILEEESDPCP